MLENNLVEQTQINSYFNEESMPYKPDIIVGFNGKKVLMNVLPASQTMKDTMRANGQVLFRQKIMKQLSKKEVETVSIPINAVVDYDIANRKLEMREHFDFIQELQNQISSESRLIDINFEPLSLFGA